MNKSELQASNPGSRSQSGSGIAESDERPQPPVNPPQIPSKFHRNPIVIPS